MLRGMFGGGAEVETVLHNSRVHPGGVVEGVIHIAGGHTDRHVNFVELALVARVEVESGDDEYNSTLAFHRIRVAGAFPLRAGSRQQLPFQFPIPWETPPNNIGGQQLRGVSIGLRTELDIARSMDKGDVDPLEIVALPSQEGILAGLSQLGFRFKSSDLEKGHVHGSRLPFYQEIEFAPPSHARHRIEELEVTFVTDQHGLKVVLELDRRGFFGSSDQMNSFHVDHHAATQQDWAAVMGEHLNRVARSQIFHVTPRQGFSPPQHFAGQPQFGHPQPQFGGQPQFGAQPQYGAQQFGQQPPGQSQPFGQQPQQYGQPHQPVGQPQQYGQEQYGQPSGTQQVGQSGQPYGQQPPPGAAQPVQGAAPAPQNAPLGSLDLGKARAAELTGTVTVTLTWDTGGRQADLDASAVVVGAGGRALSEGHVVFYNNQSSPEGAVRHGGDDSTRGGAGEQITVDLAALPGAAQRVQLIVSVDTAGVTLDQLRALRAEVSGPSGAVLASAEPAQRSGTALVLAELERAGTGWTLRPVGGGHPGGFAGVLRDAGLGV